ncbi:MAG: sigma-70 family RNA polymerase sigma factor [Deltaproteobacteria bacterium]|nr:MAG: sigma-70 family RNA polymerase sigma factor [Deltaproteobacteria bacterium]
MARAGGSLAELCDAEVDRLWLRGADAKVLEELHRRYHRRLESVAYRILGNRADAEDAVQNVFQALPTAAYRGASSLWTYLYRAATHASVTVLRSRRRREGYETQALGHALLLGNPASDTPEAQILELEIVSAVAKALLAVKESHRRVLVLRIVWGLANTEIAEREGVPVATVGTWLRRGREELRRALRPLLRELGREPRRDVR